MSATSLTFLSLAMLFAALLLLRSRWYRLRRSLRRLLLTLPFLAIAAKLLLYVTHWSLVLDRGNVALYWLAVAGYLLLLTILSLNRPRWLNSLSAIILALPLFSTAFFAPLPGLFTPSSRWFHPLGHQLYASWQPFIEGSASSTGTDLDIAYRPPLVPFLQHSRLGGRFYDTRCNSRATEVRLQPDSQSVFVHCPQWPASPLGEPGYVLRLH